MGYSDPNYTVRREVMANNVAGAASASMTRFLMLQKAKLKSVSALVNTAGTNAAAGVDIFVGTTSVGAITLGTGSTNAAINSGALNVTIPQDGYIDIRGKANSATLNASFVVEYEVLHDGTKTP